MQTFNKITPTHTYDWYVKWAATLVLMVGMITTSQNIYPINLFINLIGLVGWLVVAIAWHDRALIAINAVGISIYSEGILAWMMK